MQEQASAVSLRSSTPLSRNAVGNPRESTTSAPPPPPPVTRGVIPGDEGGPGGVGDLGAPVCVATVTRLVNSGGPSG